MTTPITSKQAKQIASDKANQIEQCRKSFELGVTMQITAYIERHQGTAVSNYGTRRFTERRANLSIGNQGIVAFVSAKVWPAVMPHLQAAGYQITEVVK